MNEIYKKVGKRYVKIGHEFGGFPCDGIWQVRNGMASQTLLISEKEVLPVYSLSWRTHIDGLCKYVLGKMKNNNERSLQDEMTWVCDYFAEVEKDKEEYDSD